MHKRKADVGGRAAPDTRAKLTPVAFEALLSREAGTWGLIKNSKMAAVHQVLPTAVRHGGFFLPRFEYFQGL